MKAVTYRPPPRPIVSGTGDRRLKCCATFSNFPLPVVGKNDSELLCHEDEGEGGEGIPTIFHKRWNHVRTGWTIFQKGWIIFR